jgi:YidC/Oxa1 family membrane protein insertase
MQASYHFFNLAVFFRAEIQLINIYGDDKQKMGQKTMELYKQEKVNPVSGCLPIMVQIPV